MNIKSKTNKILGTSLVAIMLVVMLSLSLTGCATKLTIPKNDLSNDFSAEIIDTQNVKLAMSAVTTVAENGSVSKKITATVLPATATNKTVDWSVEWGDDTISSTVTEYVTVTPDSDGSVHATVTCHKAFMGTVIVTVTTRESGYTAACIVSFVGIPSSFALTGSVATSSGTITLGVGKSYEFDVALSNPFNSVGSQFNNITCNIYGVGSIVVCGMERRAGVEYWFENGNKTITVDSVISKFITATYADGKLTITTLKTIESYYASSRKMDGGRTTEYIDKFRSFVDDSYFEINIYESASGLSKHYIVRFDASVVTGVNSNLGEMQF